MLEQDLPESQKDLTVAPRGVTVVLAENGSRALTFELPPLEDLAEMEAIKKAQFSIHDLSSARAHQITESVARDLVVLKKKAKRFEGSPKFHNRVANLAALIGDLEEEASAIDRARKLSQDPFFIHRAAENLLARHRKNEAEILISKLNLSTDLYANLRLAFFHVQRRDFEKAQSHVTRALEIDPLDFGAQLFIGGLSLLQAQYARAIHAFRIASDLRNTSAAVFSNMAIAYFQLGQYARALSCAKRSVALDPLNASSVVLLADLAFRQGRNEDAIPSLRYFVEFDQKNDVVWARLARASLHIGKVDETIAALKQQGGLRDSSEVWNNLGVTHQHQGNFVKGMQAFHRAMTLAAEEHGRDYFLAARNLLQAFAQRSDYSKVIELGRDLISEDSQEIALSHDATSDIYSIYMHALLRSDQVPNAMRLAERLLQNPRLSPELTVRTVISLIAQYALNDDNIGRAKTLFEYFDARMDELVFDHPDYRVIYYNNVAFAFAEFDQLALADRFLSKISTALHKSAYPTATLGLIAIRKGAIDRGVALYEEASRLALESIDRARIRQKLNTELGRYWTSRDPKKAKRFLTRAIDAKEGEANLVRRAKQLLLAVQE